MFFLLAYQGRQDEHASAPNRHLSLDLTSQFVTCVAGRISGVLESSMTKLEEGIAAAAMDVKATRDAVAQVCSVRFCLK